MPTENVKIDKTFINLQKNSEGENKFLNAFMAVRKQCAKWKKSII